MAYLGQGAEGNFTTTNAKDTFSGDGSETTFTLSQRGTENNVDVFVNNVRQEPGVAYNIEGNGTSLVFTAAPSTGTNNIYVVNRGPAELSASHPASQNLEAADGTFTGDLTVDTNTLYVDSTNNRVAIGTTSPSYSLDIQGATNGNVIHRIKNSTAGTSARAGIFLDADDGNKMAAYAISSAYTGVASWQDAGVISTASAASGGLIFNAQGGDIKFQRTLAEKVRITSNGLTFNGDTAAANALDDYEEGTWTAGLVKSGVTFNIGNTTGYYVKIGNLVHFNWYSGAITWTGTQSGNMSFTGLPFTSSNSAFNYSVFNYVHGTLFSSDVRGGYVNLNNTNGFFVINGLTSAQPTLASGGTNRYVMITGTYYV